MAKTLKLLGRYFRVASCNGVKLYKILFNGLRPISHKARQIDPATKSRRKASGIVVSIVYTCLVVIRGTEQQFRLPLNEDHPAQSTGLGKVDRNCRTVEATPNDDCIRSARLHGHATT